MCGYIRRVTDSPAVRSMLEEIGLGHLSCHFEGRSGPEIEHFYPAFGGDSHRQIRQLIVPGQDGAQVVNATWWFDCEQEGDRLRVGKRTTFNARNLDSPYWKGALRHHRGLVVATGLGESKKVDDKKHQFLMEGERPFLMGALFQAFDNGCFSCAVITRDSHPRFDPYHDKAFPCFLPSEPEIIDAWLNDTDSVPQKVADYLKQPQIVVPLTVSEVKAFKHGKVGMDATRLHADGEL